MRFARGCVRDRGSNDNKAVSATYVQTPDKKYKVTLTVQAKKLKSDGSGNETPMAMADYIPDDNTIGVTKP